MKEEQFTALVEMVKAIASATVAEDSMPLDGRTAELQSERHEAIIQASIELVDNESEATGPAKPTARDYMYMAKALARTLVCQEIGPGNSSFEGFVSSFTVSLLEENPDLDIDAFRESVITHHLAIRGKLTG